ncbi:MAG: glycosyltransferase, partial [Bacteroidota bacterium]
MIAGHECHVEIIVGLDQPKIDGDLERFVEQHNQIKVYHPGKHLGRSEMRNSLVSLARFDWVLFIDADCNPAKRDYLRRYLSQVDNNRTQKVICGGIRYASQKPMPAYRLHWTVGSYREQLNHQKRNKQPWRYFFTGNVLIRKELLISTPFERYAEGYGYEDIALGYLLFKTGVNVRHISNEVIHEGLKDAKTFLRDSKSAMQNLSDVHLAGQIGQTPLITVYEKMDKYRLVQPFLVLMSSIQPLVK